MGVFGPYHNRKGWPVPGLSSEYAQPKGIFMILKSSDQVEIQIDNFGYLIIDQHPSTGEEAVVFLSYDQTLALYNFIRKNIK